MGAMCITSTRTDARCGSGGAECKACGACLECSSAGACTPAATARWDLICASAVITPLHDGEDWDSGSQSTQAPDPYCELILDGFSRGTTETKDDTLMPAWNESISGDTPLTSSVLTATVPRWAVYVYDEDSSSDHEICSVSERFTTANLTAGTVTFTGDGDCQSLTLKAVCAAN